MGPNKISSEYMKSVIERLKGMQTRVSTAKNYLNIWRKFNSFLIRLDRRPHSWEDRASLFGTYLVDQGYQSSTLKSYISAIKHIVKNEGYQWEDSKVLLYTLARACKQKNDTLKVRLPIHLGLFELILFEVDRVYPNQPYLSCLYKAIFSLAYYGLMRIGELVAGAHTAKAKDVYIATNKNKIQIVLYSSKTHDESSEPQKITISEDEECGRNKRSFCPFRILSEYYKMRGDYASDSEHFFVFSDQSEIKPQIVQSLLKRLLDRIGIDGSLYGTHSFRIGRGTDLIKYGVNIEIIKRMGRWKSNAVYRYLRS